MDIGLILIKFIIAAFVFYIVYYFYVKDGAKKMYLDAKERNLDACRENGAKKLSYEELQHYLISHGANFSIGPWITPFDYVVLRGALSIGGLLLGLIFFPKWSPLFAVVGYMFLPMYIDYRNTNDNKELLEPVRDVYGTLGMLSRNGVYLASAVYECYLTTKEPRLKQALLELSEEITAAVNIRLAAENFRNKFDNPYIDGLAKSIEQSLETGDSAQVFSDVSKQMQGIGDALYLQEEQRVNNKLLLCMTLAFMAAVLAAGYTLLIGVFGDLSL